MFANDQEIVVGLAHIFKESIYAESSINVAEDPLIVELRNDVIECSLHFFMPEGLDARVLRSEDLKSIVANTQFDSGHTVVLRSTQSFLKYAEMTFGTKDDLDSTTDGKSALSGKKVNDLVINLYVEQLLAFVILDRVLEASVKNVLSLQHTKTLEATE